jgi:hypothetical protein
VQSYPDKKVIILLIFRDNTLNFRKSNIKKIIDEFKNICNHLTIEIEYRDEKGNKI